MSKICLDAGHGGSDPGAVNGSRKEKDDALKLTLRVGEILKANGHSIYYTRTNDIFENVNQKAREANNYGADFFASFHRNSASASASGYETLVYSNSGKAKVCADAANSAMAQLGFKNRGTKIRTDLAVLNGTKMEAVLFEVGFISNSNDNKLFDSKFEEIAKGLASAIAKAVGTNINSVPNSKPSSGSSNASKPSSGSSSSKKPTITFKYRVKASGKWYPEVKNLNDYAGVRGKSITDIAIGVDRGSVWYQVHIKGGGWLPKVTGYNINDAKNGYAGNGQVIDAVRVYYNTPADYAKKYGYQKAQYRVSPVNGNYYSWQYDNETAGSQDGYAGAFGKAIDRFQIC